MCFYVFHNAFLLQSVLAQRQLVGGLPQCLQLEDDPCLPAMGQGTQGRRQPLQLGADSAISFICITKAAMMIWTEKMKESVDRMGRRVWMFVRSTGSPLCSRGVAQKRPQNPSECAM